MNFILKPSLEHIALVKVATLLWNQQDIRALVTEFSKSPFSQLDRTMFSTYIRSEREKKWPVIQDQVIEKMAQLVLPIHLKAKLVGYIQSIGIQISKWMKHHLKFCCLELPNEFCWTPQGTIDGKRTAEVLITIDSIDIVTRFILACLYCLEDDVPELWKRIPQSQVKILYSIYNFMSMTDIKNIFLKNLLKKVFWTFDIKIDGNTINHGWSYETMLSLAAESGNKAATEFFLQKKSDLKEKFLLNTAVNLTKKLDYYKPETESVKENYNEVLCFLLSQMSTDQQVKLFRQCSHKVLYCLLDWPFQSLFVETVKLVWNFLPKSNYHLILFKIIEKEFFGYKDYNYKKVFWDVWQEIPDADKSFIINDKCITGLLDRLLHIKDRENLKLIFQSASPIEKNNFIFSDRGYYFFRNLITNEEWDLVKFFVQLLLSSKDEIIQFKLEFQEYIMEDALVKGYWYKFSRILDDFIRGYDKRNADEGESSSAKRFCNVEFKDMSHGVEKEVEMNGVQNIFLNF